VPTHELLERAVSDRPVIIHNTSEHALWVNAKALAFAGINDPPVADPAEERNVIRDASGHPSGLLLEAAMELVERAVFAALSQDEKLALLRDACQYLNRFGITSVVNATGSLPGAVPTLSSYVPEESITVEQAVNAYTLGSAYARFPEDRLGTLETGKEADLAVLSQDIFSAAHVELAKTHVVMTMVGGKVVFTEMK